MPYLSRKPCGHPGCPKLVISGRCDRHQRQTQRMIDERRGTSKERGYGAAWRRVRLKKLAQDPLCQCGDFDENGQLRKRPRPGCGYLAQMVHHIKPISIYPKLRLVMDNLRSLTNGCHETLEKNIGGRPGQYGR